MLQPKSSQIQCFGFSGIEFYLLRFVSDFDIRISDFSFKVWLISLSVCANG